MRFYPFGHGTNPILFTIYPYIVSLFKTAKTTHLDEESKFVANVLERGSVLWISFPAAAHELVYRIRTNTRFRQTAASHDVVHRLLVRHAGVWHGPERHDFPKCYPVRPFCKKQINRIFTHYPVSATIVYAIYIFVFYVLIFTKNSSLRI